MKILEKIVPSDPNVLAGKPISVTKFKDGEILVYDATKKQWKAGTVPGGSVALTNYYNKTEVNALIPTVPTDISELTDTEGLLNSEGGGLTKAQILGVALL